MEERKDLTVELVSIRPKRKFNELAGESGSSGEFHHDTAQIEGNNITNAIRMEGTTKEGEKIYFTVDSWTYGHDLVR